MTDNVRVDVDSGTGFTVGRRAALATMLGGAMLAGGAAAADAQTTSSSVDTAPLQFALNMHYITTNYLRVVVLGTGNALAPDLIRGGEGTTRPGVAFTSANQVAFSSANRDIRARLNEMQDEHRLRVIALRAILRDDAPAQKQIDLSPTAFTALFRMAGAIAADATFNPYASEINCVLGASVLLDVQATALAGILASMTNDIARSMMAGMVAGVASHATTVRSIVYTRGQTQPGLITMVDQLAAWSDRIDGTSVTDRGLSATVSGGETTTRTGITDADGLYIVRTPEQALNVLFMTSAAVTQGGLLPTGINGAIARSAAN